MSSLTYKTAFIFYIERRLADPLLRERGLRSPRGRFIFGSLLVMIVNYIISTIMIRFTSYAIYITILSCFPLINVVENLFRATKNCFSWYVVLCLWWPTIFFGVVIRGVYTDIVGLKPVNWLGFALGGMLLFGTVVAWLQHKFGPWFFVPKSCIPGFHRYVIPVSKVPQDKLEDECIMCYYPLKYQPDSEGNVPSEVNEGRVVNTGSLQTEAQAQAQTVASNQGPGNQSNTQALMKKAKFCMVTPCKHYFHKECLDLWLQRKSECPVCRHQLKFFE